MLGDRMSSGCQRGQVYSCSGSHSPHENGPFPFLSRLSTRVVWQNWPRWLFSWRPFGRTPAADAWRSLRTSSKVTIGADFYLPPRPANSLRVESCGLVQELVFITKLVDETGKLRHGTGKRYMIWTSGKTTRDVNHSHNRYNTARFGIDGAYWL